VTAVRRELVLASASPARLATLRRAGLDPRVVVSGVDETGFEAATPAAEALALAVAKVTAVARRRDVAGALVVGCDSMLDLDGRALGKPADAADAMQRWKLIRGRSGDLVTGHCVLDVESGQQQSAVARTTVHFADVSDAEIAAYVDTGEPQQVAGAFTIDGLGGAFVRGVDGDPHNVVGISLPLLRVMLGDLGIAWTSLWTTHVPLPTCGPAGFAQRSLDGEAEAARDQHPLDF